MTVRTPLTFDQLTPDAGLRAALTSTPAALTAAIIDSGLRGRGGAGFPTGRKWQLAASAVTTTGQRYVVCNADEGEPGTFKDRLLLQRYPDLIAEGMTLAGYAIGADSGYLYLRAEYQYLRAGIEQCLQRRRAAGLLGADVGGSGFNFDIQIRMGAGAYICGEESALLESMEGRRGEPRNRPPFPVVSGLFGAPTAVNNVETYVWAAAIAALGAKWFAGLGTEGSTGPKLFSISGDVARPGIYEYNFGVSLSQLLTDAGADQPQAVIVGGASGVCLLPDQFHRTLSYQDVATGGAVIVIGSQRDLLEIVENIQEFFVDESCGQCTPCRLGNLALLQGIGDLRAGRATSAQLDDLLSLTRTMRTTSKCGLGQSSPNVFCSLVDVFRPQLVGGQA